MVLGAGLGSFVQTGDLGKGIQTGMASFLGGKVLGGLSGSTSTNAINAGTGAQATQAATPGFLQAGPSVSTVATAPMAADSLATKFLGSEAANTGLGFGNTGATKGGAFTAAQQGFFPGMIGQTMTDAQLMQQEYENRGMLAVVEKALTSNMPDRHGLTAHKSKLRITTQMVG
jgi:hypothetical protein